MKKYFIIVVFTFELFNPKLLFSKNTLNMNAILPNKNNCGYNCNSFSNTLLEQSGATNKNDYEDMKGLDAGKYKKIDDKYFVPNGVNMNFINPLLNINIEK